MILRAMMRALGQMGDARFRGVLLRALALTLLLLGGFYAGLVGAVQWLTPESFTLPWIGEITFVDELLSGFAVLGMTLASSFLMFPVAAAFIGLFQDAIPAAVEARHYPDLPAAESASFGDALRDALRLLLIITVANALALVIYLVSTVLAPVIFWVVNGYLLGMEYFQLVAMRRMSVTDARRLRRRHRLTIWTAGTLMAIPLSVPVLNLLVPVLGVAAFTHIFHAVAGRGGEPS